jgi:molybdopterin-binding protein
MDGVVSRLNKGPVNAEIVIDVPLSRVRHVTAVITATSVDLLKLKLGTKVTAAFHASSVILTTFG